NSTIELSSPPAGKKICSNKDSLIEWLAGGGARLGLDVLPAAVTYSDLPALLKAKVPALLELSGPAEQESGYDLLIQRGSRHLTLLTPGEKRQRFPTSAFLARLQKPLAAPYEQQLGELLRGIALPSNRRAQAERKLLDSWLRDVPIPGIYTL